MQMRRSISEIVHDDGVLSKEKIAQLLVFVCQPSRLSYSCPNDCSCGKQFMRGEAVFNELVEFRHKFWGDPDSDSSRCDDRRERLCDELSRHVSTVDGSRTFSFKIGAVLVCKSFFRAATGLPRQLFDGVVADIREITKPNLKSDRLKPNIGETEAFVLGFLDAYFSGFRIQHDPVTDVKAMVYSSWLELYENEFKLHSRLSQRHLISYPRFCSIRLRHRKGYTIARVYRKRSKCVYMKRVCYGTYLSLLSLSLSGGYNHMACDTCDNYKRAIKAATSYKTLKQMEVAKQDHINRMVNVAKFVKYSFICELTFT